MLSFSKRLTFLLLFVLCFSLTACDNPEEKEAKYIERGNTLFEQKDYQKAELEYKNALRINPTSPEAIYRMGLVAEAKSDFRSAFLSFQKALQQNPDFVPALVKSAEYYLAGQRDAEAKNALDKALALASNNAKAHALLASYYVRKEDYETAQKEINTTLEKDPSNVRAFTVQSDLYMRQDKVNEALGALDEGIARNPGNLALHLLKAFIFEKEKDFSRLEQAYEDIFRLRPQAVQFRIDLANIYAKAGQNDKAEASMRKAMERFPQDMRVKHAFIQMIDTTNGYHAAEKEIQTLRGAEPKNEDYILWLAELYIQHKDTAKAIDLLHEMTQKEDGSSRAGARARSTLANLYLAKGNKETAEKLARAVLKDRPDNIEALLVRAHLSFEEGKYQEAVNDLRSIIRVAPKNVQARLILAEILLLQRHVDLAIDTLGQVIALDPANERGQIRLAQLLDFKGDTKKALALISGFNERNPQAPIGWETRARIALSAKDIEGAKAAIEKLDSFDGYKATARFLDARLAAESGDKIKAETLYKEIIRGPYSKEPVADQAVVALIKMANTKEKAEALVTFLKETENLSPTGRTLLAEGYIKIGEKEKAAEILDQILAQGTKDPQVYIDRTGLFLAAKETDKAIEILSKAIEAAPMDLRAQMMRADLLGKKGLYKEALKDYESILAKSPNADIAANNMAQLIADTQPDDPKQLEKARLAAERFISSSNPIFLDTLAWVYFRLGDLAQAQTIMARIMNFEGTMPPSLHYHNGAILIASGKTVEGRMELQKALGMNKPFPEREETEKLLKSTEGK